MLVAYKVTYKIKQVPKIEPWGTPNLTVEEQTSNVTTSKRIKRKEEYEEKNQQVWVQDRND